MMLSASTASALKHVLLGLIVAALCYALLGSPPGSMSMIVIGGPQAKLVHCALIGLLAVLADVAIDYM